MLVAVAKTFVRNLSTRQDSAKMVIEHHIQGYENFVKFMENFPSETRTHILFTGTKLPDGESWCADCIEAEPFLQKGLKAAPENSHLIRVEVGNRAFWKDLKCPFRTDARTKLNVLPTLSRWGTQKRLEGYQCLEIQLVEMLVTDGDD